MVKRKADASILGGGSGRGKAAARPPPPLKPAESNNDDDDDSDLCEVVEGPPHGNRVALPNNNTTHNSNNNNGARAPPQAHAMVSRVAAPPSHVAFGRGRLGFAGAMTHQGSQNGAGSQGAVLSMLAAAGLSNPPCHRTLHPPPSNSNNHLGGFGFPMGMGMGMGQLPQMQMQHMASFAFGGAPGMYVSSPGFQVGDYSDVAGFVSPSSPAFPPPEGQSSAAQPQAFQRVFEGTGSQEVKEEPDYTSLCPTQMEAPLVAVLRGQGVPSDDAVQSLRANGHNVAAALKHALMTLTDRENSRNEDMARYASEQEKEKAAAARRQEDMSLTVLGDIVPRFQESLLLDEKHGCAVFRRAIHEMCCGHESCPPALYDLREKAVKLLFLERDAFKWYRDVKPQVRGYFRQLAERLEQVVPNGNDADSGGKAGVAQTSTLAENGASIAQESNATSGKGSGSAGDDTGDDSNRLIVESDTRQLTARVVAEIKKLQIVLFGKPSTSGGVPDAFLACNEHSATLEVDGVEELRHESAAESRSSRGGQDIIVINDSEDG